MGKGSRQKGSSYERKIAQILSQAFAPLVFKRVPLSGGWDKSLITGDIIPWKEDEIAFFAFSIECKNHKTLSLRDWLRQAKEDVEGKPQKPVVVFHINRRKGFPRGEDFVAIDKKTLAHYLSAPYRSGEKKIGYNEYNTSRWKLDEWLYDTFAYSAEGTVASIFLHFEDMQVVVLRLRDFLGIVDKKKVRSRLWCALEKYFSKHY